jgi:ribosomal protein S18 acetylase RimI-like enzyme
MALVIRPRTDDDLGALLDILRESHETDGYPLMAEHVTIDWLTEKGDPAWVATLDDTVVGHSALSGPRGGELELARLFVSGAARGRGVADALIDAAERHAATTRSTLVLEVLDHNTAAIHLYERRGWLLTSSEPVTWFGADGPTPIARRYAKP